MSTGTFRFLFGNRIAKSALALLLLWLSANGEATAQNFWQPANGPYGGNVWAFAINTSGQILAGTDNGGVFRSTNNGASWTSASNGLTNLDVRAFAINASGHIFTGTYGGIFRSTDSGSNWTRVYTSSTNNVIYALAINGSGQIFAGTLGGGILRSTDNGGSWTPANAGLTNMEVRVLIVNAGGHILAGTYGGGVFRSTDNGANWTPINAGLTFLKILCLATNSQGHIFAGTDGDGIFRSTDNGGSWAKVNNGVTNLQIFSLHIDGSGTILAGTPGGVFRSTDNGGSWTKVNVGLANTTVLALAVNSSGHIFAGTLGEGVFRSTNSGSSWVEANIGLANASVKALVANVSGYIFAGTAGTSIFRSTDNGVSWAKMNMGLPFASIEALAVNASGHIFAGLGGSGVYRSMDNGNSWSPANTSLTSTTVRCFAINASGHIFAGGVLAGVFRSTNNGASWTPASAGLTDNNVQCLAINSSGHLFAGTSTGGIFRSMDNGSSWTAINTGLTNTNVWDIVVNSSGHIFAGSGGGGVFRSTDNGNNWSPVNSGLTDKNVWSLAINASGHIFAGTVFGGVLRSMDNGNIWTPVAGGLNNTPILSLAVNPSGYLFAGTHGSSVFRSVQSTAQQNQITFRVNMSVKRVKQVFNPSNRDTVEVRGSFNSWDGRKHPLTDPDGDNVYAGAYDVGGSAGASIQYKFVIRRTNGSVQWEESIADRRFTLTGTPAILPVVYFDNDSVAGSGTINFGETRCDAISNPSETDTYTFVANSGDKVLVRMSRASGSVWPGIRIVGPNGGKICEATGSVTAQIDSCVLNAPGTYTILAFDSFNGTLTGNYCLYLQRLNNPGNTQPISFGQTLADTVNSVAEIEAYTFAANAGDKVLVRMSRASGSVWPSLRIYAPNGAKLCEASGSVTAEIASCTVPVSGNCTVLAFDSFNGTLTGGYNIFLQRLNNPGNALSIKFGPPASGTINSPADMDTYTFAAQGGAKVLVRMSRASGSVWPGIRIYRPDGLKLCEQTGSTTAQIDSCLLPVPGTYMILAYDSFNGTLTGTHNVSLACLNPPFCEPTQFYSITGRVFDNSGTAVTGATVIASGPITASTSTASDGTYTISNLSNGTYSVTASKAGYASPSAKSVTVPPSASNVDFVLQRAGNTPIMPIASSPQLAGQEFWVDINVGNNTNPVSNLFGISFCLTFTRTDLIDVVTPYSSNVIAGPFLGTDVIFQSNVDETTGKVCIGVSRKTGQGGVSGSGIVARVKFMSKANTPNGTQVQFCTTEVIANDPNGNPISLAPSCMTVTINSCLTVWSGDTNNDGKVDQADVLPLGLYWGRTGSVCQTPPNCTWAARCCAPWTPAAITYVDANGDGVVNQADVLCLGLNWGKTHSTIIAKTNQQTEALRSEQNATIEPEVNALQAPSQEFFLRIKISEVTNLFGLSFELLYDQMPLLQILSVEPDSMLGSDVVFYSTVDTLNGKIAVGISRKAGQSGSNGTGSVVRVRAKISGKANNGTKISFALQNVVANDANGAPLDLTLRSASTTVLRTAVAFEREMSMPAEYWLGQNYPNPFNPSTAIAFSLPRAGHVTLKVYDILGKEIATLVNQHLTAGRHEATWEARGVESGVYFYQLRAGEFVATKKLILMK